MINQAFNRIKLSKYYIKNILKEIDLLNKGREEYPDHQELKFNNQIYLKNISFKFDKNHKKNIVFKNLTFKKNNKYLLMGKSGSGKTTFANIFSGLIFSTKFKIFFDNNVVNKKNISGFRKIFSVYDGKDILIPRTLIESIALSNNW